MASVVSHFSYSESDIVVTRAIKREKSGNLSAYIRRAIESYEAQGNGPSVDDRLAAIEELLRGGIISVMPDAAPENEQDQIFDTLLEEI